MCLELLGRLVNADMISEAIPLERAVEAHESMGRMPAHISAHALGVVLDEDRPTASPLGKGHERVTVPTTTGKTLL